MALTASVVSVPRAAAIKFPSMTQRGNLWLEIGITIIAPSLVLMKGTALLGGPLPTLGVALAFPLGWGLWQSLHKRSFGLMAWIGLVSTLLTGGIGALQLDAQWLAFKEAAVPAGLGLAVAVSALTRNPLIHALMLQPAIVEVEKVQKALAERNATAHFDAQLKKGTLLLAGTFFFSSAMNYILARWIVTSPAGSEAFNEELGRLTLLSYPMIALPSLVLMMLLLAWLARQAKALTGLEINDMLVGGEPAKS